MEVKPENSASAVQIRIFACSIVSKKTERQNYEDDLLKGFRMFVETFRIGHQTTLKGLKSAACSYWGLIEKDFGLYRATDLKNFQCLDEEQGQRILRVV